MAKSFDELFQSRPRADPTAMFSVRKADDEMHIAFGWASVADMPDGSKVVDYQHDMLEMRDLEKAAYEYVLLYRAGGEMHERPDVAVLVESCVFTAEKMTALGIPEGTLPYGWWIGLKITDDDVWEKVKNGEYSMFSIEGTGAREEVDVPDETGGMKV